MPITLSLSLYCYVKIRRSTRKKITERQGKKESERERERERERDRERERETEREAIDLEMRSACSSFLDYSCYGV